MDEIIISLKEAKAQGLRHYYTGTPCKNGHISKRLTSVRSCMECFRETSAVFRKENPGKVTAALKRWRDNNKKYTLEYNAEYNIRNKQRKRDLFKAHYINNIEYHLKRAKDQRAKRKGASGDCSMDQLNDLFDRQKSKCVYCLSKLTKNHRHLDHIEPLARGGSNDIRNLQWTCPTCNLKKKAKDPIIFAQQIGMLL